MTRDEAEQLAAALGGRVTEPDFGVFVVDAYGPDTTVSIGDGRAVIHHYGGQVAIDIGRQPREGEGFAISIGGCARCGGDHESVTFRPLGRPMRDLTHWGTCPATGEPILATVDAGEDAP